MVRAQRRLLVIIVAVFLGVYFFSQNHWFYVGHVGWLKWLLLGLGLWIVVGALSSRPRRGDRHEEGSGYHRHYRGRNDREILDKIERLQNELRDLRSRRDRENVPASRSGDMDAKLADLTERIVTLEKIVTDRRHQLDEKINRL